MIANASDVWIARTINSRQIINDLAKHFRFAETTKYNCRYNIVALRETYNKTYFVFFFNDDT